MSGFRRRVAVLCAKWVSVMVRILRRRGGSVLPGYVAQLIDPGILPAMAEMVKNKIIVTMGTNGKTTTNSMICHALRAEGKRVLINRTGANMRNGIISSFVAAADCRGRLDVDYACIEVDEFAAAQVLPALQPDCILLTNLFRDQIDRFGELDIVCERIRDAIASVLGAVLAVNCDDPLLYALASGCGNSFMAYGLDEQIFDDISNPEVRESTFCPLCGRKMEYAFFHYGQLGAYRCPHCGWKRPLPDCRAEGIEIQDGRYRFELDGMTIYSQAKAPYNVYNTLSAYVALKAANAPVDGFQAAAESFDYENRREETFFMHGTRICLCLAKNPVGFQQKISLICKDASSKDILVQINDAAQDGKDISWLWDVDFQHFKAAHAATVSVAGTRRLDMALRLRYDDISCYLVENTESAVRQLAQSGTGNLYLIVNYSGLSAANRMLHRLQQSDAMTA